jgi:hypothetical protein
MKDQAPMPNAPEGKAPQTGHVKLATNLAAFAWLGISLGFLLVPVSPSHRGLFITFFGSAFLAASIGLVVFLRWHREFSSRLVALWAMGAIIAVLLCLFGPVYRRY